VLYLEGKGVDQSTKEAAEWFKRAALKGLPDAMLDYGVLVFRGEGVQKDEAIGAQWLVLAAQHGVAIAQNRVARLYMTGKGVRPDAAEAVKWHILARTAGKGDPLLDDYIAKLPAPQIAEGEKRAQAFRPTPAKVQDVAPAAATAKSPESAKSDPGG
jgi:TPR repeat protein